MEANHDTPDRAFSPCARWLFLSAFGMAPESGFIFSPPQTPARFYTAFFESERSAEVQASEIDGSGISFFRSPACSTSYVAEALSFAAATDRARLEEG
jgi:hypothetical protein